MREDKFYTWLDELGIQKPIDPDWLDDYIDKLGVVVVDTDRILYQMAINEKANEKVRLQAIALLHARLHHLSTQKENDKPVNFDKPFDITFSVKKHEDPKLEGPNMDFLD